MRVPLPLGSYKAPFIKNTMPMGVDRSQIFFYIINPSACTLRQAADLFLDILLFSLGPG
jgi:hypothetical protein